MNGISEFLTMVLLGLLAICAVAIVAWLAVVIYLGSPPAWMAARRLVATLWNLAPVRYARVWLMQSEAERCRRDAEYWSRQGEVDFSHRLMCKAWALEMKIRAIR